LATIPTGALTLTKTAAGTLTLTTAGTLTLTTAGTLTLTRLGTKRACECYNKKQTWDTFHNNIFLVKFMVV
jgi:hypothetical protein